MGISIYENQFILLYFSILVGLFGAIMGSFLHCVAYRIVSGESFAKGRSHCPKCGHVLGILDLIPCISWLILGGKCRYCKEKIPARYFFSELFMAGMSILCLLRFDLTVECLCNLILLYCLFTLSLVDFDSYIIPNECLLIPAIAFVISIPFRGWEMSRLANHGISAIVFAGGLLALSLLMDHITKKDSLGGGDIKLFGVVGLYLGFFTTLFTLLLSCVIGLIFGLCFKKEGSKVFPFGPSIAIATWIMLLYGHYFVDWYLGFFGL